MAYIGGSKHPAEYGSDGTTEFYFDPQQVLWLIDDFVSNGTNSALDWNSSTGGTASITQLNSSATHPGVMTALVAGSFGSINYNQGQSFLMGGGQIIQTWTAAINTLSSTLNRCQLALGFRDQLGSNSTPTNCIEFEYQDNVGSGEWQAVTRSGGTATTNSTGITADTNYHRFKIIVNAAGTSVGFYIDDVLVVTNTTNIPTVAMYANLNINNTGTFVSGNCGFNLDLFNHYQFLTTSR